MRNVTESNKPAFDSPKGLKSCGVLNRGGIYYASLYLDGQELPLEVALHGVSSEGEAQQAFATLLRLRQARCGEFGI